MDKKPKKILEGSQMNDLISIAEAARLRGVTHAAVQNLINRGRLQAHVVAGRRLLRRGDVEAFTPEVGGRGRKAGEK
jgi:excisionase family DNA binding protein